MSMASTPDEKSQRSPVIHSLSYVEFFDAWSLGQGAVHQYQEINLLCWLVSAPAANESSCCCNLAKVGQGTVMIPEVPSWFVTVVITCNL